MMLWPGANNTSKDSQGRAIEQLRKKHEEEVKFLNQEAKLHDRYMSHFAVDAMLNNHN